MVEITEKPIAVERIVKGTKTDSSGCVVTYVGVIRDYSQGKPVRSVEYKDPGKTAQSGLQQIVEETRQKWQLNNVSMCHRIGILKPGEINLVVAVAAAHRGEGFTACQYAIDRFKQIMPTRKKETYRDGSVLTNEE